MLFPPTLLFLPAQVFFCFFFFLLARGPSDRTHIRCRPDAVQYIIPAAVLLLLASFLFIFIFTFSPPKKNFHRLPFILFNLLLQSLHTHSPAFPRLGWLLRKNSNNKSEKEKRKNTLKLYHIQFLFFWTFIPRIFNFQNFVAHFFFFGLLWVECWDEVTNTTLSYEFGRRKRFVSSARIVSHDVWLLLLLARAVDIAFLRLWPPAAQRRYCPGLVSPFAQHNTRPNLVQTTTRMNYNRMKNC